MGEECTEQKEKGANEDYVSVLTSDLAVCVGVPACVQASGGSCEVHDGQSFSLEIAPV